MKNEYNIPKLVSIVAIIFLAIVGTGCTSQENAPFEPTSQLDYHDG